MHARAQADRGSDVIAAVWPYMRYFGQRHGGAFGDYVTGPRIINDESRKGDEKAVLAEIQTEPLQSTSSAT